MPRLRRAVMVSVGLLAVTPVCLWISRALATPELYPGDDLERRTCRQCEGTGEDPALPPDNAEAAKRCPFCKGRGRVDVILPGPHRPTRFHALVVDAEEVRPYDSYGTLRRGDPLHGPRSAFSKPRGALSKAEATIRRDGGTTVERSSNPFGLFHARLAPGSYTIRVTREGFDPVEATFEVPPLTEPIWLEEARLIEPPRNEAQARSLYGLEALVVLDRPGSDRARVVVRPGAP